MGLKLRHNRIFFEFKSILGIVATFLLVYESKNRNFDILAQ